MIRPNSLTLPRASGVPSSLLPDETGSMLFLEPQVSHRYRWQVNNQTGPYVVLKSGLKQHLIPDFHLMTCISNGGWLPLLAYFHNEREPFGVISVVQRLYRNRL